MRWRFWKWLFKGINGKAGILCFLDRWLVLHVIVAIILSYFVNVSLKEAASTVLLPLASVCVGLSFAWAGNSQALLQDSAIEKLAEFHPDGIENYVYKFLLAILTILVTMAAWGMAGLGLFSFASIQCNYFQIPIKTTLYTMASITLRACWSVVVGSQLMLLSRYRIRKTEEREKL
jgi:hypothetical protein